LESIAPDPKPNTIAAFLREAKQELSGSLGTSEAMEIIKILLEKKPGVPRNQLFSSSDQALSEQDWLWLKEGVEKIIKEDFPVQYWVGEAWFGDHCFEVNPSVLIPRPETEELVAWVWETWISSEYSKTTNDKKSSFEFFGGEKNQEHPAPLHYWAIDVGTGSGCIPIQLCTHRQKTTAEKSFKMLGIDVSKEALLTAQRNAHRIFGREWADESLYWEKMDVLGTLGFNFTADLLVSNPPYIPPSEKINMENRVVGHEPHLALFTPAEDPYIFYKAIAGMGQKVLTKNGYLFFETHYNGAEAVKQLMEEAGYEEVVIRADLQGVPRMVRGKK